MTDDDFLETVTQIRATTNTYWMHLVRIALRAEPEATRAVLRRIVEQDTRVSEAIHALLADGGS